MAVARSPSPSRAVSLRALLLGVALTVFVNVASPYMESVGFSNFSWSYLPEGALIPFLLVLALNALPRRWLPRTALTAGELLVVFAMALAANSTAIFLCYFHLSAIVSPHYFASPANRWEEQLFPHLRPWLIVSDEHHAVEWFYQGLPAGESIPWMAWLTPLSHWLPFLFAIWLVSYLLTVLFQRQWVDNEKLSYPLMQLPLELVRDLRDADAPALWRNRLFWWGVGVPSFFAGLAVVHQLVPAFPCFPVDHLGALNWGNLQLPPPFPPLRLCLSFLALGTGIFVPTNLLCSIWVLYLLVHMVEETILTKLGINMGYGGMFTWGNANVAWQSFGAYAVMIGVTVWSARQHLVDVIREALAGRRSVTAAVREELLPPRMALLLFAASVAFIGRWLVRSGMPPMVAVLFVPTVFLVYLGLSRVVCELGVFYVVPPMIAQNVVLYGLGSTRIGAQGIVSLGLTYAWHGDVQTVLSALSAESAYLQRPANATGRGMSFAILLVVVVGLIVAPAAIIRQGYHDAAIKWPTWVFRGWGPNTYNQVLDQIRNPFGFSGERYAWAAVGAAAMLALTAAHRRFLWWPIHPLGLAVVSSFTMYAVYLGFFLAWLAKTALLRWGGHDAYRRAIPLFLGLCVGHYVGRAAALLVNGVLRVHWTI